jgi:hypothetical protein
MTSYRKTMGQAMQEMYSINEDNEEVYTAKLADELIRFYIKSLYFFTLDAIY